MNKIESVHHNTVYNLKTDRCPDLEDNIDPHSDVISSISKLIVGSYPSTYVCCGGILILNMKLLLIYQKIGNMAEVYVFGMRTIYLIVVLKNRIS
jgi:hypothetical protein